MATTHTTCRRRSDAFRRSRAAFLSGVALALVSLGLYTGTASATQVARTRDTSPAPAYGWPVKPFHHQHPVRGFFGDPRIGMTPKGMRSSFHFGIDISCANGTPVYATVSGEARLESFRPETVAVVADDRHREMQYWHVRPTVRNGQRVVAYRTVIGHVEAPWAHVHFSEMVDGEYVNPLRAGAIGPYHDTTRPRIARFRIERSGRALARRVASGRVDLVVEASDTTPLPVPAPWDSKPVTPAALRWRVLDRTGRTTLPWRTAVDVRATIPSNDLYDDFFARWTRQNKAARQGRYRFYLAHGLETSAFAPGRYAVQVEAVDTRGNTGRATFAIVVGAPAV